MPVDISTIESLDLFENLNQEELEKLAELLNPRDVKKGEILFKRGGRADTFFIIISGKFKITYKGGKTFELESKSEIMGWSTVVTPFEYTGSAEALIDSSVLWMPGQEFFRLLQSHAAIGEKIMNKINQVASERKAFASGTEKTTVI